jgi:hypothetical protein
MQASPNIKKFHMSVDYSLTYQNLVELGRYRYVDQRIRQIPPLDHVEIGREVSIKLVHFGSVMLSSDVLNEFEGMSLMPATFIDLLAFSAMVEAQVKTGPVLALDSKIVISGKRLAPCFWESFRGRALHLFDWNDLWRSHCNFLAVHK